MTFLASRALVSHHSDIWVSQLIVRLVGTRILTPIACLRIRCWLCIQESLRLIKDKLEFAILHWFRLLLFLVKVLKHRLNITQICIQLGLLLLQRCIRWLSVSDCAVLQQSLFEQLKPLLSRLHLVICQDFILCCLLLAPCQYFLALLLKRHFVF